MTEQETKRRKNRKRRKKRSTINVQNIEEPAAKKIRLSSQEADPTSQACTTTQVELTSTSKEIINDTRVSEISGQENLHLGLLFDTQSFSDRAETTTVSSLYTNGIMRSNSVVKTYNVTVKDLINLAQIKENEHIDEIDENKHTSGRPVITFSISDNNLTHLELIHDEIAENFISKEQIDNLNSIQIGNNEVNGETESQTGFVENFKEHNQIKISVQNSNIENSNEHKQIKNSVNNGHFKISKRDDNLSKQFLRHTNSKHLPPKLEKYKHLTFITFSL
jgi:predicted transcriptional regulator